MKLNRIAFLAAVVMVITIDCFSKEPQQKPIYFYVGSSSGRFDHSIFLCKLDEKTNKIALIDSFTGSKGSSYLDLSPDRQILYAVDGRVWDTEPRTQTLSSFVVDLQNNSLKHLNSQSSQGSGPCHIYCNKDRSYIFTANYGSGSIAAFPLSANGEIQAASDVVITRGSGPNESRQSSSHPHYVSLDPGQNFLLSPDLGADRVLIFRFDKTTGKLTPNESQPYFQTVAGAGPRHLDFHPNGKFLYIINELNGTLTACRFDKNSGAMTELSSHSTLPGDLIGNSTSAAVRVHPNGKFVYATNRGDQNSIAAFRIQKKGGIDRFQVLQNIPNWPRDFNIDPTGRYLFIAGERSNEIEVFLIDQKTGDLSPSGEKMPIRSPGNILFLE